MGQGAGWMDEVGEKLSGSEKCSAFAGISRWLRFSVHTYIHTHIRMYFRICFLKLNLPWAHVNICL